MRSEKVAGCAGLVGCNLTFMKKRKVGCQPRCHGEPGIPELLYPHTKFPSECCTQPRICSAAKYYSPIRLQYFKFSRRSTMVTIT